MATKKVSFRISEENLEKIDQLVRMRGIKDRSEFFNAATQNLLDQWAEVGLALLKCGKQLEDLER